MPKPTDGTVPFQATLDSWISTVVQNLSIKITHSGTRKKQYRDLFRTILQLARNQIVGTARCMVNYWLPQDLFLQTTNFHSTGESKTSSQRTGTLSSPSALHPKSKSTSRSTEIGGLNTLDHTLASYMTASSPKLTKNTYKSLHLAQTFATNVFDHYLQTKTEFRTNIYLVSVDFYLPYS